ncbi:hypothetical protein [Clostridiisalibacter paucivorans]|uniref:hypothetical protein n=1 Tax=Clostridiisalibacter paucivorans TaxID=408753 RepID=UPI00047CF5A9|nr:hypothetical protein [Clostridiisalibacter paucivorans]
MKTRLRLLRLIISGERYKRTLNIDKSLIIIKGDGFSGKSLVLNLIAYCLGGKTKIIDLSVQKELNDYCDEVFLELKAGDSIYTINRNLKHDKNTINIYLCGYDEHKEYSPWRKKDDEANDFFAEQFQIPLHTILRKKSGSKDLNQEKISFRDYMRYIFIHQGELGTNQFLKNNNTFISGKNKEVFKIINDLVIPDLENINKEIQIKQNELNKLEKVNIGLDDYLYNREATQLIELTSNRDNYSRKIDELIQKKKQLIKQNNKDESRVFSSLKNDIKEIDEVSFEVNKKIKILDLSIQNKEILLQDYFNEKEKLDATLEAMKKIKISEQSERCPLCQTIVKVNHQSCETNEDIEKALNQIENKIETLQNLVSVDMKKTEQYKVELNKVNEKRKIYIVALNEYKKNMKVPYLPEIESINSLIRDITEERNKINSLIDIHNEMDKNAGGMLKLKGRLETLNKKKKEFKKLQEREENVFNSLNKKYRKLMFRFNFTSIQKDSCYIDKETYLPYYSGISVLKHTSGCLLLCMQIAYLGALLELNNEEENNCHPGLLMLDTVSNNIGTNKESEDSIDPATYQEIFKYLVELSKNNQIFIVDNTPPNIEVPKKEFVFRRVSEKEPLSGLIDESKNEIQITKE